MYSLCYFHYLVTPSRTLRYNVYSYLGSDAPWVVESGRAKDNIIIGNTISGGPESIKLGSADGTEFINNSFESPAKIKFQDSTRTVVSGNTGLDGVQLRVTQGACFDRSSDVAFTPVC